jgi:GT2 family glycosyltransferase
MLRGRHQRPVGAACATAVYGKPAGIAAGTRASRPGPAIDRSRRGSFHGRMANLNIRLVCATRATEAGFYQDAALGRSLAAGYRDLPFIEIVLFPENKTGLPALYNRAIREAIDNPAVLVFVHDDVHLIDYYWPDRLYAGLRDFQIVGLIGNKRRLPRQPTWCSKDVWFAVDSFDNLSGFMAHGKSVPLDLTRSGLVNAECKLLDGVFLAASSTVLAEHGLWFDESFDFHFYDLDLCRQAEVKGVRMGTVPICVLHESDGTGYRTDAWRAGYQRYLAKWGE